MPDVPSEDPAAKDGFARDHTFPGANSALAFIKNKPEWLEKTREILKECMTVDVFSAMVEPGTSSAERVWPLNDPAARIPAGTKVSFEVVVRNRKVAHLFPTGTIDLQEPWLEFIIRVKNREPMFHSGWLDPTGRLDPFAHRYNNILLTRTGERIDVHQIEEFYATLYNNAVQLGQSDVVRYEVELPNLPVGAELEITATLNYRKFSREYTEFALGADAPRMPIILIDRDVVNVVIGEKVMHGEAAASPEMAERANDFGIAHMLQGDTFTANWAFEQVTKLNPEDPDAWINLARVLLADGKVDEVEPVLREAERIRQGYHKTAFFLGMLRSAQGRHDEAIAAYDVALAKFPLDRWIHLAKVEALYKIERYDEAIASCESALEIDPENLQAHTYLAKAYRAMGNREKAAQHFELESAYRTQREEQRATRTYRRRFPAADLEANVQHVHRLQPVRRADAHLVDSVIADGAAKPDAATDDGETK